MHFSTPQFELVVKQIACSAPHSAVTSRDNVATIELFVTRCAQADCQYYVQTMKFHATSIRY